MVHAVGRYLGGRKSRGGRVRGAGLRGLLELPPSTSNEALYIQFAMGGTARPILPR